MDTHSGTAEAGAVLELRCPGCGYGARRAAAPERCPMCSGSAWQIVESGSEPEAVFDASAPLSRDADGGA